MKLSLLLLLLIANTGNLFSQTVITGKVVNEKKQPAGGINVVITSKDQPTVLAFSISDNNGVYKISYKGTLDSIALKLSGIGYAGITKIIANRSQAIDLSLEDKISTLPTVEVKKQPITVNGDTVNYNVASFSNQNDRAIADVIARLPGFSVDASGTISYNGKAISNYYINGLDLLETRYGIANNNISHDLVDKVQLLDNHQPIKILDSLKNSTTPALNILLKKKAANKVIGNGKISAGLSPFITEDEIAAMQFRKNLQFIGAYKYNNTGQAFANEINEQALIMELNERKQDKEQENILSLVTLPEPIIQQRRYRFNDNHLAHLSALKLLKNTGQLKFNMAYLKDRVDISGTNLTTLYLPTDTFSIAERQENNQQVDKVIFDINYSLNNKKKYLKNSLKMQADIQKEAGFLQASSDIQQQLNKPFYQLTNDFLLISPVKKTLVSFKSFTALNRSSQELVVHPGPFEDILNDSLPYDRVNQKAGLTKFSTNNNISFQKKLGPVQQEITAGAEFSYKELSSNINKTIGPANFMMGDSFSNKLRWQNAIGYLTPTSMMMLKKKRILLSLPLEINDLSIRNGLNQADYGKTYFFANPSVNILIPLSANFSTDISAGIKNTLGNFLQTAPGYILNNYRTISKNDSLLLVQKMSNLSLTTSYKDPVEGLFFNLSLSYSGIKNNITYTYLYDGLLLEKKAVQVPSKEKSFIVSSRANKYFTGGKTNISFVANYFWNKSLQIQQNEFVNIFGKNLSLSSKINSTLAKVVEIDNEASFRNFRNSIENDTKQPIAFSTSRFQNTLKISLALNNKFSLFSKTEYYSIWAKNQDANNYLFADMGARYRYKKTDIEIACDNLSNQKEFTIKNISNNIFQDTRTMLRGRTLLLKAYFRF